MQHERSVHTFPSSFLISRFPYSIQLTPTASISILIGLGGDLGGEGLGGEGLGGEGSAGEGSGEEEEGGGGNSEGETSGGGDEVEVREGVEEPGLEVEEGG